MTRRSSAQAVSVFLAFLAMGFADAAGPFVSLAKLPAKLELFRGQRESAVKANVVRMLAI